MPKPKPTPAQLAALRLATQAPIRYWRGGWYGPGATTGNPPRALDERDGPQHDPRNPKHHYAGGDQGQVTSSRGTVTACTRRGWLAWAHHGGGIYSERWTLTPAGRAILDATETPCPA